MLLDCGYNDLLLEGLDLREGALLVRAHERGEAHHISGKDGGETSLNPFSVPCHRRMVLLR